MFINFNVQEVYDFLMKHGWVFTLREYPKFTQYCQAKHRGKVFADVKVTMITAINEETKYLLNDYVEDSGLHTVDEWWNLAVKLHKGESNLYLFKVEFITGHDMPRV